MSPLGQQIELGIAESNLFLQLAALGLAGPPFGTAAADRDTLRARAGCAPAIRMRGLFWWRPFPASPRRPKAAPTNRSASRSPASPSPGSPASSRPTPTSGRSCCAGPSRRSSAKPENRSIFGYRQGRSTSRVDRPGPRRGDRRRACRLREPAARAQLAIAYCGAVAPEALAAYQAVTEDIPGAGLLAITSPDRVHRDGRRHALAARPVSPNDCWRGCGRVRRSSPSATSTRPHCRGSAQSRAIRSSRSASTALASPGDITDLYRAYMASTAMPFSMPPPAPA